MLTGAAPLPGAFRWGRRGGGRRSSGRGGRRLTTFAVVEIRRGPPERGQNHRISFAVAVVVQAPFEVLGALEFQVDAERAATGAERGVAADGHLQPVAARQFSFEPPAVGLSDAGHQERVVEPVRRAVSGEERLELIGKIAAVRGRSRGRSAGGRRSAGRGAGTGRGAGAARRGRRISRRSRFRRGARRMNRARSPNDLAR